MKIGIIGAGHAGIAAAQAVTKTGNEVTLFSNENFLPYFRPRIPGIAFGQIDKETAVMHPLDWYKKQNIDLILNEPVAALTPDNKIILENGKEQSFDKIIITAGAAPIIPPFARNCRKDSVIPLWNIEHAQVIRKKINEIKKVVIIGGGVIGLEAALRAVDAGLEVTIIERDNNLMERNLSRKGSNLLAHILKDKGIKLFTGHTVERIDDSLKTINIATDKKSDIKSDMVILSIGNTFNMQFAKTSGLKQDRAIVIDKYMQSSNENFFAAGDIAQLPDIINVCSAIKAVKQGKIAGSNSISSEEDMTEFKIEEVSVLLKYKDFQLYAVGQPSGNDGLKEEILEDKVNEIYRAVVKKDNKIVGIQMIGSLTDYKKFEKELLLSKDCSL
jgi:NAD(P)H-nitrite reductase large subunit